MSDEQNINLAGTVYEPRAASAEIELAPGELFDDRYRVLKQLGAGGMGVAYLAQDELTEEEIVLKVIHPSLVDENAKKRMIAEGVNTRKIKNPNVVSVHDVKQHDDQIYLTMEYVKGQPLRHWMATNMANRVNAPLEHITLIVHEILAGLAAAHNAGVIHRDLKPENIVLSGTPGNSDFSLRILDFGIATGLKSAVFTSSAAMVGTPLYMAPEQKTMPDAVGPSADIYSVGRMLYEMLMDVLPDGMWNPPSVSRADVPPALDAVIQKSLQPPKGRYQSAAEFAAAIAESLIDSQVTEPMSHVWQSVEGQELAESLKKLNSSLYSRITGGVNKLNTIIDQSDSSQGQAQDTDHERLGADGKTHGPSDEVGENTKAPDKKSKTKWYIAGALILVAALISEFLPLDEAGVTPTGSGAAWRLDGGGVFNMSYANNTLSGSGVLPPIGAVSISGNPESGQLQVHANGQYVADISGSLSPGQTGVDFSGEVWSQGQWLGNVKFHIDH